jgi:hypothetical protein
MHLSTDHLKPQQLFADAPSALPDVKLVLHHLHTRLAPSRNCHGANMLPCDPKASISSSSHGTNSLIANPCLHTIRSNLPSLTQANCALHSSCIHRSRAQKSRQSQECMSGNPHPTALSPTHLNPLAILYSFFILPPHQTSG